MPGSRYFIVAARWFAPPPYGKAFDTPLSPVGSLLPVGVCYRALRRLPGQDFHLQEQRVLQDAPLKNGSRAENLRNYGRNNNSPATVAWWIPISLSSLRSVCNAVQSGQKSS